jgi:CAAX protease family protein
VLPRLRLSDTLVAWLVNLGVPIGAGIALAIANRVPTSPWAGSALLRLAALVVLVGWLVAVRRLGWDDFRRLFKASRRSIGGGIVIGLVFTAVSYLAVVAFHFIERSPNLGDGTWNPWVGTQSLAEMSAAFLIAFVLVGPIVEEFVHRGVAYGGLRSRFQILIAASISSVVFALGHDWYWPDLVSAFIFGMVAVWLVERYDSLSPAIAAHIAVNLSVVLLGWSLYNVFGIPGSGTG